MKKTAAVIIVLSAFMLVSCSTGSRNRGGAAEPGAGEVIVVGKVVMEPAPERGQSGMFGSGYNGGIRLFFDNVMRLEKDHENSFWENWPVQVQGEEDEAFFYPVPARRMYCVMATYLLGRSHGYESIHMPVAFVLDVRSGDRAIYLGTIKFTRDLYYNIKKIDVIDEYAKVLPEFTAQYGKGVKLRKALAIIKNK